MSVDDVEDGLAAREAELAERERQAAASPAEETLQPGDRVLFFTDGIVEERLNGGELFGTPRLIDQFERAQAEGGPVQSTVTRLSHALMAERGGSTSDDATLFLLEWCNQDPSHLAVIDAQRRTAGERVAGEHP